MLNCKLNDGGRAATLAKMECEHPASYTARAVKKALPERAMLTKDARQTLNSAASMFTLYLSSVAHDYSVSNKRQTIVLKDVLHALKEIDFEHFIEPIEECLRDAKISAALKKSKKGAEKSDAVDAEELGGEGVVANDDDDDEMQSAEDIATEEEDGAEVEEEEDLADEEVDGDHVDVVEDTIDPASGAEADPSRVET